MVPQLAPGIETGDVPNLMGMDLIYGPQFTPPANSRTSPI